MRLLKGNQCNSFQIGLVNKCIRNIKSFGYLDEDNNPIDVRSKKSEHDGNFTNAK